MIARLLAVAEGIRSRSPELWSPYVETAVDVTRAAAIPGGYVGGAVQCGRIAPPALAPADDRPRSRALVLAQIRVSRREIGEQLFGLLERIARPGTDSAEPHTTRGGKRLDGGVQHPPGREFPLGAWAR